MRKRKALGSGLEALLSTTSESVQDQPSSKSGQQINGIINIPIDKISRNPSQPRKNFSEEALSAMGETIKLVGQLQPIIVKKTKDGYELIAGERRWRAMQTIRSEMIQAVVIESDQKQSAIKAIVENVQREQLNAIEECEALNKLYSEYGMNHDDIAKFVGKSRSHVTNIMRLNSLSEFVKSKLMQGLIEMGHARSVLTLSHKEQEHLIRSAIAKKMSVRQIEKIAQSKQFDHVHNIVKKTKNPDTAFLERELTDILGAKTKITASAKGKGTINIRFTSIDELQGIIKKIKK